MFDLDLSGDIFAMPSDNKDKKNDDKPEGPAIKTHKMQHRQLTRRASSENALLNSINWYFEPGDCYHCFSFGDVDFFSYLQHIARQERLDYVALSTWCMSGEDILEFEKWYDRGILGRMDLYVGEIFKGSYPDAYDAAVKFLRKSGGRMVIFRNHAKIAAIKGPRFDCLIESSANVNTNPRSENTVLTVDTDLVDSYIELFNEIYSFDRSFDDVKPYEVRVHGEAEGRNR